MLSWVGWVATAVFVASYFCKTPARLRLVQAVAAVLWTTYGLLIHAMPVIVANVIVTVAAVVSAIRESRASALAKKRRDAANRVSDGQGVEA